MIDMSTDRLLEGPLPPAARSTAWPRSRSGASGCRSATSRSTRRSWPSTSVTLQQVMDAGADALDAGLLRYSDGAVVGTGGFVEADGQRLNIEHVQPIAVRRGPRPGPGRRAGRQGPAAGGPRRGPRRQRTDLGRRRHQRRPGPHARRPEVPRREHDGGDPRRRGGHGRDGARACRASRSTPRSSVPRRSSSSRIDNLTRAMFIGILLVMLIIIAFLFEWRTAFISLHRHPAVAGGGGAGARPDRCHGQRDGAGRAGGRHRGGRRRRHHRRREHRQTTAPGRAPSGSDTVDVLDRPGGLGRGPLRDHLRHPRSTSSPSCPCCSSRACPARSSEPLVLSYALAVLVSMVVALTLTPALCLLMLSRGTLVHRESPLLRAAQARATTRP